MSHDNDFDIKMQNSEVEIMAKYGFIAQWSIARSLVKELPESIQHWHPDDSFAYFNPTDFLIEKGEVHCSVPNLEILRLSDIFEIEIIFGILMISPRNKWAISELSSMDFLEIVDYSTAENKVRLYRSKVENYNYSFGIYMDMPGDD